jgi:hypothetical protein
VADVYNHERPGKVEQRVSLLNLRSPDPDAMAGGARSTIKLCGGDILAALKSGSPRITECTKYYSYEESQQIMALLAYRKYQNDLDAAGKLERIWVANIFVEQLKVSEKHHFLEFMKEVRENEGVLSACCKTVIEDVCDPHLFSGLSAREWARLLKLKHHRLWQDGWRRRYDNLRAVLHELDCIMWSQFQHKT